LEKRGKTGEMGKNVGKQVRMGKSNGKLSLYPLKFEQAVKDLLRVKSRVRGTGKQNGV